jgi:hypothetical protein
MTMDLRRNVTLYMRKTGWLQPESPGARGELWEHEPSGLSLPVPFKVSEGSLDWLGIAERLAQVEHTSALDIQAKVLRMSTDIANLRAANDVVIHDSIPYEAAATILRSSWTMLRSCSTTSMRVTPYIRGNYNRRADEVVRTARMAHTRKGSFIIPVVMPVNDAVEIDPGMLEGGMAEPEPVERRVMRTFAESLSKIFSAVVEPAREPRAEDIASLVRSGVTAEFASALHSILAEEAVAQFGATFEWSPLGGRAPEGIREIAIPGEAAPLLDRLAGRLRDAPRSPSTEVLTGPIHAISRDEPGGVVTIDTMRNSRPSKVSVRATTDLLLDEAIDWMKRRVTVVVTGRIVRRGSDQFAEQDDSITTLAATHLPGIEIQGFPQ